MKVAMEGDARRGIDAALRAASRSGRRQWVVLRQPLPTCDTLAHYAAAGADERFYWEQVDAGRALAAYLRELAR